MLVQDSREITGAGNASFFDLSRQFAEDNEYLLPLGYGLVAQVRTVDPDGHRIVDDCSPFTAMHWALFNAVDETKVPLSDPSLTAHSLYFEATGSGFMWTVTHFNQTRGVVDQVTTGENRSQWRNLIDKARIEAEPLAINEGRLTLGLGALIGSDFLGRVIALRRERKRAYEAELEKFKLSPTYRRDGEERVLYDPKAAVELETRQSMFEKMGFTALRPGPVVTRPSGS